MNGYLISGIQQIGVGVTNVSDAFKWYNESFGMDCRIFEEEAVANLMLPYTGGQPRSRHAILALNLQSGGGFEIWQYKGREPEKSSFQIQVGDLGIFSCKMKVRNIKETLAFFNEKKIKVLGAPVADPHGKDTFFATDPYGNIFQFVEATDWFMNENKVTGGAYGTIIGVTNIEKSKTVYCDILGYNEIVYDVSGVFPDLSYLPGGEAKIRRVLLKRSEPFSGPFSKVFGQSFIELVTVLDKTPKKIFEDRYWGDPGFIHLCYDIQGMTGLRNFCESKGFPFSVDSEKSHDGNSFDMGEAAGHFSYIEDPDGTLIEFVETHKVPILKKIGWYLDLSKRKPGISLPNWILKTLRYSRVKA
jgi:catechol 2,3-dioxygenase-like lactoylglutathione lyase family enzyme